MDPSQTAPGQDGRHEHERAVAAAIVARLRENGHEAWLVGGCVREILLGGHPADYDVTTDATPDRVSELFPHVVEVGKQFGVVMVVEEGVVTEVATFRTEGSYTDGRRPDEVRFASAAEDVARRDFTVNALLMDPVTGEVVDHVGGRADLQRGILRTVGDPRERFAEDHLRMLRAVRFAARLGFRMQDDTRSAITAMASRVVSVSPERVRDELTRMFGDKHRGQALRMLADLGLLEHVLPEVHALTRLTHPGCKKGLSAFEHVARAMERLRAAASEQAAWATLLHDVALEEVPCAEGPALESARAASAVVQRLRMSNRDAERIVALVRDHRLPREAPSWPLHRLRPFLAQPMLEDLLDVARAEGDVDDECTAGIAHLEQARLRWGTSLPDSLLTGDDLLAAGVPRGPAVGRLLEQLRAEQLDERLFDRSQALARAAEILREA